MPKIKLHPKVQKQIKKIKRGDRTYAEKIAGEVTALGEEPRPPGAEKLVDSIYRIRVGDYRIIYSVFDEDDTVIVGKIDNRNERTYSPRDLKTIANRAAIIIENLRNK